MQKTANGQRNSLRIIAGDYRSRKLEFPEVDGLRPTSDRIRETLFNWLQGRIQEETCLDLFSGSGALGFEALSQGAKQVDFVEKNRIAANGIIENLERFDVSRGALYCDDAFHWLEAQQQGMPRYGLVFLDPPFGANLIAGICAKLDTSGLLKKNCLVYVEVESSSQAEHGPETWFRTKSRKTGAVRYSLYEIR